MHHQAAALESPISLHGLSSRSTLLQNPILIPSILPVSSQKRGYPLSYSSSTLRCNGLEVSVPRRRTLTPEFFNCSDDRERLRSGGAKVTDVAAFGNLCVDIVLNVPELPPGSKEDRQAYMNKLAESPPDKKYWEAGGNSNMAIAAARLGLSCIAIGHVGDEIYGKFFVEVLREEGIGMVEMSTDSDEMNKKSSSSSSYETLLCWVLVDPLQRHGFCSRADFSEEPAFKWMSNLTNDVKLAIRSSKTLFCNGYCFDELAPGLIVSALEYATEVGTAVFFDPGPKGKSLSRGTSEEQRALREILRMSDVILLTSEEAESLTYIKDPVLAGKELLKNSLRTKWVIIKLGAKGSILITMSSISCAPGFKVNVVDTVGCGDSFVAAIAFGLINDMPMIHTLTIGNAIGAATATGSGAGRNVATNKRVLEILRDANLNEDEVFWNKLLSDHLNGEEEITLLSKSTMLSNTISNKLKQIPLNKVTTDILPLLERADVTNVVPL
ncbi:fructokinase-1 [Impatiens glandulifera]|uniref:fructokinase-1 n=1 Tax=Impatiens glandulifera TaxID=253017 RepID=UPI001FB15A80|nr:fructokinase-1 [Impatiens glandulifera]